MHSLPLCMCGVGARTCKKGLLCIWDTQKWTFVYVWCWGWDMHSLSLFMCGIGVGTCKSGLLCIWDTQKLTFVYVW